MNIWSVTADVDECDNHNAGCDHLCVNEQGSYHCECHDGYSVALDAHSCLGKSINDSVNFTHSLSEM